MDDVGIALMWRISDVAAEMGVHPSTIRHYEALGLLGAPARTVSGHRYYTRADREQLRFISTARLLGLTVEEIRDILMLSRPGHQAGGELLALIDGHLAGIDRQLNMLAVFREQLAALRERGASSATDAPDSKARDRS